MPQPDIETALEMHGQGIRKALEKAAISCYALSAPPIVLGEELIKSYGGARNHKASSSVYWVLQSLTARQYSLNVS